MQNNIYVDTNIIIDICDNTRAYHKESLEAIIAFGKDEKELYINSDTYSNLFYILDNRTTLPYQEVLAKMKLIATIFTLVETSQEEINTAIVLCEDDSQPFKDYEDTLQYVCAKKVEADLILTNDKGFIGLDIEVQGRKTH